MLTITVDTKNTMTKEIKEKIAFEINAILIEIQSLRKDLESSKSNLNELKSISKRITDIQKELNPNKNYYDDRIKNLNTNLKQLKNIEDSLCLDNFDQMFIAINNNLIDGMHIKENKDNPRFRKIVYEDKEVGFIEAIGEEAIDFDIRIRINDLEAEWKVENTGKIYTIVSFINNKFNYKTDKYLGAKKIEE